MPRRVRNWSGNIVYHVPNRAVGRSTLLKKKQNYFAFEKVLEEMVERTSSRLLSYCVMLNHWHLLAWPREAGELSEVMRWLAAPYRLRETECSKQGARRIARKVYGHLLAARIGD